jgi:hypothetical protein
VTLQFGNLKIENQNDSKLHFNSLVSMLPRPQTRCLLTKQDIPKLFFIKLLSYSLEQPLPGSFNYVFFAMSREVRSELSQCIQIDRPGSSFYVEVRANLSMIKNLGGVEAGSFMIVILRAMNQNNVHQLFHSNLVHISRKN